MTISKIGGTGSNPVEGTKLPSRGYGLWREEFYSFHSNPKLIAEDTEFKCGIWRNVYLAKVETFIWNRSPSLWRWFANKGLFGKMI